MAYKGVPQDGQTIPRAGIDAALSRGLIKQDAIANERVGRVAVAAHFDVAVGND